MSASSCREFEDVTSAPSDGVCVKLTARLFTLETYLLPGIIRNLVCVSVFPCSLNGLGHNVPQVTMSHFEFDEFSSALLPSIKILLA